MLLQLLAYYEHIYEYVSYYWGQAKHYMRHKLGPEPQQWILLRDGQVLPHTTAIPEAILESAYIYDPNTRRITQYGVVEPVGRYRPLQYIAMNIQNETSGIVADASDWLGEIRCNPVPLLSIKQVLQLWMYDVQVYVPMDGTTKVTAITNSGDEEVVTV
jgi:hypothetical protein